MLDQVKVRRNSGEDWDACEERERASERVVCANKHVAGSIATSAAVVVAWLPSKLPMPGLGRWVRWRCFKLKVVRLPTQVSSKQARMALNVKMALLLATAFAVKGR